MSFFSSLVKHLFHIDIEAIRQENESLRDSLSEEREASKRKDMHISQMQSEAKSLRREVANLKSRKTLLEGEVSALKHKLTKTRGDSTTEDQEYRYTIAKIETWRVQNEEAIDKIENLQKELLSVHKEFETLTKKHTVLQNRYNSVKSELDALRQGQSSDVSALQSECARLTNILAAITSDRDRLSEQIQMLLEIKSSKHTGLGRNVSRRTKEYETINSSFSEPVYNSNDNSQDVNSISLIIESIRQSKIIKNQRIAAIVKALIDNKEPATNKENSTGQVIDSDNQKKIVKNQKLVEIISSLVTKEDVYNENVISANQPEVPIKLSEYDKVEVLVNNATLYSDGEDWYLSGIEDPLASYHDNDEVSMTLLSEKYQIYNLTIKKNQFIGQKPIEFYFSDNKIFKFDKASKTWTLWYSFDETTMSLAEDISVSDDNQLKLIKDDVVLYIDSDGTVSEEAYMDEPVYVEQIPLRNGYFIVKLVDGYWGIVDDEDNYAVLAQYNLINHINDKYLRFQSGDKWGVMNLDGDILIEANYNSIESYCNGGFMVTKENPSNPDLLVTEKIEL